MKHFIAFAVLLVIPSLFTSCKDDDDDPAAVLVAAYDFDRQDYSCKTNNEYDGTKMGLVSDVENFITDTPTGQGYALHLEDRQYVRLARNPLENISDEFSVSLWIKDCNDGATLLYTDYNNKTGAPTLSLGKYGTLSVVAFSITHQSHETATVNARDGQWHMLTVAFSKLKEHGEYPYGIYVYFDGERRGSYKCGGVRSLGTTRIGGSGSFSIDNLKFYRSRLTNDQVRTLYNQGKGK